MRPAWMCLLFALAACNGDEPAPVPTPVEPTQPEQPEQPEQPKETKADGDPWDGLEGFDKARSLTAARKFRDAVQELEAALTSDPGNGSVWALLRHAANAGGESGELLDRLDASTAIGGQEVHHWTLRAELALDADRPADALAAARKLAKADAELGAVYTVRAIQAGATFDMANLDKEDPNDALVLASKEKGAKLKRTLDTTSPESWQGLALRAELWDIAGDKEAALADLESAAKVDDPYAHVAVNPGLADRVDDDTRSAELAADAARNASELGLAVAATDYTMLAADLYIAALKPAEGLAFAIEMRDARAEAKDAPGTAWTNVAVARLAQADGQLDVALAAASDALAWAETEKDNDALGAASWEVGETAWLLGLDEPLLAAAALSDDKKSFEALASVLVGSPKGAAAVISASTAKGSDGVLMQLAAARAAWASGESTKTYTAKAVKLADDGGHVPDRILARLESHRYATLEGADTTKVLGELARIAEEIDSDALRAEVGVRTLQGGGTASLPEGSPWAALADGANSDATDLPGLFAQARFFARDGRHDKAYDSYHQAFSQAPVHHVGPWAPLSVLDGRAGPGIDNDARLLVDQKNAIPAGLSLLVLHEWWHGQKDLEAAFQIGDDPSLALEAEQRIAYNTAHRHLQARSLLWLSGAAEEPLEARKALADADAKAMEDPGFARSLPPALADYRDLRESLGPVAVLSYRLGPKGGEAVALTKADALGIKLDTPKVAAAATALGNQLRTGVASGGAEVTPMKGDVLRVALLDPFQEILSGTARYLIIPDGPLWEVPLANLPEQQAGRRYLADIRTIAHATTVASAYREYDNSPRKYNPEYLGLSVRPENQAIGLDGTRIATETENTGRHFMSDLREIQAGEAATSTLFTEKVPRARFIHLADVTAGSRGAIHFADGEVDLVTIREQDLWSLVTILAADTDTRVMRRWTQAFHAAGVPDVVSTAWATPLQPRSRYFFAFFENYMQEGEVPRALTGARNVLMSGSGEGDDYDDPSWWGPYFLSGKP